MDGLTPGGAPGAAHRRAPTLRRLCLDVLKGAVHKIGEGCGTARRNLGAAACHTDSVASTAGSRPAAAAAARPRAAPRAQRRHAAVQSHCAPHRCTAHPAAPHSTLHHPACLPWAVETRDAVAIMQHCASPDALATIGARQLGLCFQPRWPALAHTAPCEHLLTACNATRRLTPRGRHAPAVRPRPVVAHLAHLGAAVLCRLRRAAPGCEVESPAFGRAARRLHSATSGCRTPR